MPMLVKELTVSQLNEIVKNFKCENPNIYKCFLIDEKNPKCIGYENNKLFKEHFLVHKFESYENRRSCYEYINKKRGIIILHCKDDIRSRLIKKISKEYPNIKIIIAHLGRNVYGDKDFIIKILNEFKNNDNIYTDTSTVIDPKVIELACQVFDENRILFGTDIPFASNPNYFQKAISSINDANISIDAKQKILYLNAQCLLLKANI